MQHTKTSIDFRKLKNTAMLVMAMTLAGSSVVVGKIIILRLPVFLGAFLSLLVAFVAMLPLMYGRYGEIRKLTQREWKYLFLQGLCGIVLFRVFTLYGLHSTGAVQAGVITGTTPAMLALLSFLLLGERLSARSITGIAFGVAGCLVINLFSSTMEGKNSLLGCLLVLAAVVCEALFTIFRKRIATSVAATTNTAVLIFCSLLLLVGPALWEYSHLKQPIPQEAYSALIYYGLFATVLAYLLWTSAVGHISGAVAGASTAAMPAASVILAVLVLGERLHWQYLAGCLFIIAGIFLTASDRLPRQPRTATFEYSRESES